MELLQHIRQDHTNFNQAQFAQAVQNMHGFSQYPITGETIADLEDPNSPTKYPETLLKEVALYCTRIASVEHSRLIEYQDILGFQAKAVPDNEYVAPVAQEIPDYREFDQTEPEAPTIEEDTSPALPIALAG